jgi:hypothetical protein
LLQAESDLCEITSMSVLESQTIQLIIIGIAAAAVVLQAIFMRALFATVRKSARSMQEQITELRASAIPLLTESREFLTRVGPELESTATDVAAIVHGLRVRGSELEGTAADIVGRLQQQAARVDGMMTEVLNSVDKVGGIVSGVVSKPARQLFGIVASIKAVIETLRSPAPRGHSSRNSADRDGFV